VHVSRWPAGLCAAVLLSGCATGQAPARPPTGHGARDAVHVAPGQARKPGRAVSEGKAPFPGVAGRVTPSVPKEIRVPYAASGRYAIASGHAAPRHGEGPVVRYLVEVERGLPFDRSAFAAAVHRTLNDPRGWGRFERVDRPPVQVRVALSSPATVDRQCLPMRTGGALSCWNGTRSVINALRWAKGVEQYRGDLGAYRQYVINHEVGHGIGHGHHFCPGRGERAPVMAQQSKTLDGCRPNPWPFPHAADRRAPEHRSPDHPLGNPLD